MTDFSERDTFEQRLQRFITPKFRQIRKTLTERLNALDSVDMIASLVQHHEWAMLTDDLRAGIEGHLAEVYISAATEFGESLSYAGDAAALETAAGAWAEAQSFALVTGMNRTSQRRLEQVLERWRDTPQTNEQLTRALRVLFGEARAKSIAITEVTRAASEGQERLAEDLRSRGAVITTVWQTMQDELVCPICGPRHNMPRGSNWTMLPPAHPNCRCFTSHEIGDDDASG